MKYVNGDEYKGNWLNGKPSGVGIMNYDNGDKYEGNWLNGEPYNPNSTQKGIIQLCRLIGSMDIELIRIINAYFLLVSDAQ